MPRYTYVCHSCGEAFDAWRTVALRAQAPCPHCGAMANRKWEATRNIMVPEAFNREPLPPDVAPVGDPKFQPMSSRREI